MEKEELIIKIRENSIAPSEIPSSFFTDQDIVIEAIKTYGDNIKTYLNKKIFNDKSFLIRTITETNFDFEEYLTHFLDDREIILAAVKKRGLLLGHASKKLQNDYDIVYASVENNWESLKFASPELQENVDIAKIYIKSNNYSNLTHISSKLKKDKEFILPFIKINGKLLKYVGDNLKEDYDIVKNAMISDLNSLRYASPKLKRDCEFMLELISINEKALKYVHKDLLSDPVFMVRSTNSYQLTLF